MIESCAPLWDPAAPLPPGHSSPGWLERVLRAGEFAVTAELDAPDSANPRDVWARARVYDGFVDALNCTDGSGANCHMSSVAVCALLTRAGYAPVLQVTCRDRNRIAIQGELLGAAALGVTNVLCLTGDGVQVGDHPAARPVFDLDCLSLLDIARTMRDEQHFQSGRHLTTPPRLFLGAAANPFAPDYEFRIERLAKKIIAGAQFIQTQYCFDLPRFEAFMHRVRDHGLDKQVFILAGIGPLKSARAARWMRQHVPGVQIPDRIIDRIARSNDERRAGIDLCIEFVQWIRELPGVRGVHLMAYRQEEAVAEIIERSGVLGGRNPGRAADYREPGFQLPASLQEETGSHP